MRKLRLKTPGPSAEDRKRLQTGIETYGLPEVHQMVEWLFKQKNDFWRKRLKAANFACSFLCDSLPSIKRQFDGARNDNTQAAEWREQERTQRVNEAVQQTASDVHEGNNEDGFCEDLDYGSFEIPEDELEA